MEARDFWNQRCVHSGERGVQAEHCFFYGSNNKAIQEEWNLVPVAPRFNYSPPEHVKSKSRYHALKQAKDWGVWDHIKQKYPRRDWEFEWNRLEERFGKN